jgi:glutathione synthase/RimK-type ligase-like ATP-grasp enzyme
MKYRICILANENPLDHELWVKSIKQSEQIESYDIVDITSDHWLDDLNRKEYDLILMRPPGKTELLKRIYDERILLIHHYLQTPVYPSVDEILLYENKRYLSDWLKINGLPHPETHVFFDKTEAIQFIDKSSKFPIIAKTNIGASGNGVVSLTDKAESIEYVNKAFSVGIRAKTGPKLKKGSIFRKIKKVVFRKGFLSQRLKDYQPSFLDIQFHYVIFQKYIAHDFEWRVVRIGDSFFAHKKIAKQGKASGTLKKGYDEVPLHLLNFIKSITDKHHLTSMAIDVFEQEEDYLINEIQCCFGQSDPYQMLLNGKPGRYIFKNGEWQFEEGMFNTNESYDLRLEHALSTIPKR